MSLVVGLRSSAAGLGGPVVLVWALTSTSCGPPAPDPAIEAARLVERAIEAMGGAEGVAAVTNLAVRADCTGPDGSFTTEVESIRPDRTFFRQTADSVFTEMVMAGEDGWWRTSRHPEAEALPDRYRSMVRGHEFHFILFELGERFQSHRLVGPDVAAGKECTLIVMTDNRNRPASTCFDPATGLPVRLTFLAEGDVDPIEIAIERWEEVGGLLYLGAFALRHRGETFIYAYTRIDPGAVDPAVFTRDSATP